MVPEHDEPKVPAGLDKTPTIREQAAKHGWHADVFNFGKAEEPNISHFNPGLVRREDGLWLLVRRATYQHELDFGHNSIWACKLNDDMTPHGGKILQWPQTSDSRIQYEDARAVNVGNQVLVSACTFIWYSNGEWTGAHQVLCEFSINPAKLEDDWVAGHRFDLEIDGNGRSIFDRTKHQKNWTFFTYNQKLHLHYSTNPWVVVEFDKDSMAEMTMHTQKNGVVWNHGEMRGGSPPVRVDDLFWTFNHSSLPWTGRYRKYFMGAVAFEAKPPFKPVLYTPKPIFKGSQKEEWADRKPLVVFPGGAVIDNGVWTVVYGINDMKSGYAKIPHKDLLKLCVPIPEMPTPAIVEPKESDLVRHLDAIKREFRSPVAKARIMKVLKNAPILSNK